MGNSDMRIMIGNKVLGGDLWFEIGIWDQDMGLELVNEIWEWKQCSGFDIRNWLDLYWNTFNWHIDEISSIEGKLTYQVFFYEYWVLFYGYFMDIGLVNFV